MKANTSTRLKVARETGRGMTSFAGRLVVLVLAVSLVAPSIAAARPLLGTGDFRNTFQPRIGKPKAEQMRTNGAYPGIWADKCRTGDIIVGFSADSNYVVSGFYNWGDAKNMFGHAGMFDARRYKGLTSDCILWYDDTPFQGWGGKYYHARWVSPSDLWGRYDTIMVLRPKGSSERDGQRAMDWAIKNTASKNVALDPRMVDGSWYYVLAVKSVLNGWNKFLTDQVTGYFPGEAKSAVLTLSKSAFLKVTGKVLGTADTISSAVGAVSIDDPKASPFKSGLRDKSYWYGTKTAYHAWGAVLGAKKQKGLAATTNNGMYILPIDMVHARGLTIVQWWR